jgi:hypothetical protein
VEFKRTLASTADHLFEILGRRHFNLHRYELVRFNHTQRSGNVALELELRPAGASWLIWEDNL